MARGKMGVLNAMSAAGLAMAVRDRLLALDEPAVAAAHPSACLPAHLPAVADAERLIVVGAGKAAAAMAVVAEAHDRRLGALAAIGGFNTAPYGARAALGGEPTHKIDVIAARHPTPDASSAAAAERALSLVATAGARDLVLVLPSGGASSLWAAPAAGLDLAAKTALTRGLLACGAIFMR